MPTVLFLGAGAHAPFCPDNTTLLSSFIKKYSVYEKTIEDAKEALNAFSIRIDLETVYTLLKAQSDVNQAIKVAGPWIAGLVKRANLPTAPTNLKDLLNSLESYLIDIFYIEDPTKFVKIVAFYDKFRKELDRVANRKGVFKDGRIGIPDVSKTPWHVFTTNYDNVIEIYASERAIACNTGYKPETSNSEYYVFDENDFSNATTPTGFPINLYKLHGSVKLCKLKSGKITRPTSKFKKGDNLLGSEIVENVMIFPVQEKYVSKDPYHALDSLLRKQLTANDTNGCVVVGHSFNDEAILNAFTDSLRRNTRLRVLLLSRSQDDLVKKFPEKFRERIIQARSIVQQTGDISDS